MEHSERLRRRKGQAQWPSNGCIIFKRMFETKFGQKSLKIRRLSGPAAANHWVKFPIGCQTAAVPSPAEPSEPQPSGVRLAAARHPRYIVGGFPRYRAVNSSCAARVRIKARQAGTRRRLSREPEVRTGVESWNSNCGFKSGIRKIDSLSIPKFVRASRQCLRTSESGH